MRLHYPNNLKKPLLRFVNTNVCDQLVPAIVKLDLLRGFLEQIQQLHYLLNQCLSELNLRLSEWTNIEDDIYQADGKTVAEAIVGINSSEDAHKISDWVNIEENEEEYEACSVDGEFVIIEDTRTTLNAPEDTASCITLLLDDIKYGMELAQKYQAPLCLYKYLISQITTALINAGIYLLPSDAAAAAIAIIEIAGGGSVKYSDLLKELELLQSTQQSETILSKHLISSSLYAVNPVDHSMIVVTGDVSPYGFEIMEVTNECKAGVD